MMVRRGLIRNGKAVFSKWLRLGYENAVLICVVDLVTDLKGLLRCPQRLVVCTRAILKSFGLSSLNVEICS